MDFFRPAAVLIVTRATLFNRPFIPKNGYKQVVAGVI